MTLDITVFGCEDVGENTVVLTVTDVNGNVNTGTAVVTVEDNIAPVITLNGDEVIDLCLGDEYIELGAEAFDNCDGDLTASIVIIGDVNINVVGQYILSYSVEDNSGNIASVDRIVNVYLAPMITVLDFDLNDYYGDTGWQPIPLAGLVSIVNETGVEWSSTGDGQFDDLYTTYTMGQYDKWNMAEFTLTVTAFGECRDEVELINFVVPRQFIDITAGGLWGVSSYLDLTGEPVPDVMEPAGNALTIMYNDVGQYYRPATNQNQLGNWQKIGYRGTFNNTAQIPIFGDPYEDQTYTVIPNRTVYYLPVLTNVETDISTLVADNEDKITLIYDWVTTNTWPGGGLTTFKPGSAYMMYRKAGAAQFALNFPPFNPDNVPAKSSHDQIAAFATPWNDVMNTGNPHFIIFNNDLNGQLQSGDVIGAFNASGSCSGVLEFDDQRQIMYLLAMGNNPFSDVIDGFEYDEEMSFQIYRHSTGETFDVLFTYDKEYPNYDNKYEMYGVSRVIDMTMTSTSIGSPSRELAVNIFPNPAKDILNIHSDYEIRKVSLVNYVGQTVYERSINENEFQINVSSYITGMYFVRLETTDGHVITKRVTIK
jgi:hypothetical protein